MRKLFKRFTGGLMAAVMVVSLVSVAPAVRVEAEESSDIVFNEDFSKTDAVSDWSMAVTDSNNYSGWSYKEAGSDEWMTNNTTAYLGFYNGNSDSNDMSMSRTITLPAGKYNVYLKYDGEFTNIFNIKVADSETTYLNYETGSNPGYNNWSSVISDTFTIPEEKNNTSVIISINGAVSAGGYGSFDDIKIVKYEEEAVYNSDFVNGDFETGNLADGWTVVGSETTVAAGDTKAIQTNDYAASTTNHFLNVWSSQGGNYVISQTLTLQPGKYQFGVKNAGDTGDSSSSISYQIGAADAVSKTLSALTGWDSWNETKTDSFTLDEKANVTVKITVALNSEQYEKIDDVVLYIVEDDPMELLKALIASVTDLTDYTDASIAVFDTAKQAAQDVVDKGSEATKEEITSAYNSLDSAIKALDDKYSDKYATNNSSLTAENAKEIYVEKIDNLRDDFITGVDVSSVISEFESGVTYYDFDGNELTRQGFFDFLADCGVNWVRVRVWNDPYTSDEYRDGYGGGNCDIEVAEEIGKYATAAGMKVLIDFHYSDFWTDPSKQMVPKAWKGLDVDEKADKLYEFTKKSITDLIEAGVDVGMVQIGNETNNAICGENSWEAKDADGNAIAGGIPKMFIAGSNAVREVAKTKAKNIMVAIHVANPNSADYVGYAAKLEKYNVDYDVFASSYYPYIHGSIDKDLIPQLSSVSEKYNKKVMVAETSYVYTLDEGDGFANSRREDNKKANVLDYDISIQGQADEFRAVAAGVASIKAAVDTDNEKTMGIGVFSWEPAWIPVTNYKEAEDKDEALANNMEAWEAFGSGWASSYAAEYDPDDAGKWYGGSSVDNEAIFDFNGYALESAKMYKYIRTGTNASEDKQNEFLSVVPAVVEVVTSVGIAPENISKEAVVHRRNSSKDEPATVTWNQDKIDEALEKAGTYIIPGTVSVDDESKNVSFTLIVEPYNYLNNYGFETLSNNKPVSWVIADENGSLNYEDGDKNYRNGTHSLKFWGANASQIFKADQTVTLDKGIYRCGAYLEGGYNNSGTSQNSLRTYVKVGDDKKYSESGEMEGYLNFVRVDAPELIIKEDGTEVEFGIEATIVQGTWGCFDDAYINKLSSDDEDNAARKVDEVINSIGEVTLDKADKVTAAREKYGALNETSKKMVSYLDVLVKAEEVLTDLQVMDVEDKISAIGEVTLEDEKTIADARKAFEALSNKAKEKVTKKNVLEAAEKELDRLKKIAQADAAVKVAAENADMYIDAIGTVTTLNSKATVEYARKVYDALTDEEKALVKNYDKLVAAEKAIEQLTFEATPATEEEQIAETNSNSEYKVTKTPEYKGAVGTVTYVAPVDKKATTVTIPATITYHGETFKVTAIAANAFKGNKNIKSVTIGSNVANIGKKAFYNCKNLSKITIKTSKLKTSTVGANAFKGIKKTATIKVPSKKLKAYKKLLKKKGVTSKAKIKK